MTDSGMNAFRRSAATVSGRCSGGHAVPVRPSRVARRLAAGLLLIACLGSSARAEDASKDQRQWWIDRYGIVDAKDEPLVARVESIFSRVAAAADRKGNRLPKLVVIGGQGDPYSLALKDGSVLLTLEGLHICYRDAPPGTGDSRAAFLIGHELAHLAKNDFWHADALAAVSSSGDGQQERRVLAEQLEKLNDSVEFVRTQELQADSYGILYMTMAGYDPQVIIGQGGNDFFRYWVSQIAGRRVYDDAVHLSPAARAEFVRAEIQSVSIAVARFRQGVRSYRSGQYEVAAARFEGFLEQYPGREVYNALGASRYQLASTAIAACTGRRSAITLPIIFDPETTARMLQRPAGADAIEFPPALTPQDKQGAPLSFADEDAGRRADCLRQESIRADLQEAIHFFEESEKRDADYLPARINLSSAFILSGNYLKAISAADEALKIDPESREARNNKETAESLFKENKRADRVWAGLSVDVANFSIGPSVVWWPAKYFGFQASYGQGTFTSYSIRALVRFGAIAGLTPFAGVGHLSVERESQVHGVDTRFSGQGAEFLAGAVLPFSKRFSLFAAVTSNTIELEKTVSIREQSLPATMTYNPVSVSAALMYVFE